MLGFPRFSRIPMFRSLTAVKPLSAFISLLFFASLATAGGLSCDDILVRDQDAIVAFESAVEVEIGATPGVFGLFTTIDGTIAPILRKRGIDILPESIQKSLRDYVGPKGDPTKVPWEALTDAEQIEIIQSVASSQSFDTTRTVPGLVYKEVVSLRFSQPTRFLGQDYPAGNHLVPAEYIFGKTQIEFMGPDRMTKNLGFELHVRSSLTAGENLSTARALQIGLSGSMANVHTHIVGPVPTYIDRPNRFVNFLLRQISDYFKAPWAVKKLQTSTRANEVEVYRAADFSRRAMLYFCLL